MAFQSQRKGSLQVVRLSLDAAVLQSPASPRVEAGASKRTQGGKEYWILHIHDLLEVKNWTFSQSLAAMSVTQKAEKESWRWRDETQRMIKKSWRTAWKRGTFPKPTRWQQVSVQLLAGVVGYVGFYTSPIPQLEEMGRPRRIQDPFWQPHQCPVSTVEACCPFFCLLWHWPALHGFV